MVLQPSDVWVQLLLVLTLCPSPYAQSSSGVTQISFANATQHCYRPLACSEYMAADSICASLPHNEQVDLRTGTSICSAVNPANEGDPLYFVTTGVATSRCIGEWRGDGRCDLPNNHPNENCEYDGGDCCLSTCQSNCGPTTGVYSKDTSTCNHFCQDQLQYFCLDEQSAFSVVTQWCNYGEVKPPSECYYSKLDVAQALLECAIDPRSNGDEMHASAFCGNRSELCRVQDVEQQNGCHLPRDDCWHRACCDTAFTSGFIDANPLELPTLQEVYDRCQNGVTEEGIPCFKYMVKCIQENRARKGGCCQCSPGWGGWRCRWPLCWPKCTHGTCVAPNLCHCDTGWKGAACNHAICTPACIPGQGTCVSPDRCECFYGWTGTACEQPSSVPACVNGDAVSPDICRCADGWGGRLCDYPLCQSWPLPSSDCDHGSCVAPFTCECEPGWSQYKPINGTGYTIRPWWERGKDVSVETEGNYVVGDSRLIFLTFWDRIYNSSNTEKCGVPDCALIHDPRCVRCDLPPGGCRECEKGYFLDLDTRRCERCSDHFPHCQLCGRVLPGESQTTILRCLHCDPLYVLEPMNYTSMPSGRCVSDGTIEFGSPVYHVFKNEVVVNLVVQRSTYGLDPSFARPVEVLVRTRDATAHSRTLLYATELANFEFTSARVTLAIDPAAPPPPHSMQSPQYDYFLAARVSAQVVVPIKIYDDVSYHPGPRYFEVDLMLPPEHVAGHQGPLRPFLTSQDQETTLPWLSPQDFGRTPLMESHSPLATARVHIWDREEATAANTTCTTGCQDWQNSRVIYSQGQVRLVARTHEGTGSLATRDRLLIKYRPMGRGFEDSVGIITEAVRDTTDEAGAFLGEYYPIIPGPYKLIVEQAVPGVRAEYWWHRAVQRNPPQLPDTVRLDHGVDFYWPDQTQAPAFVRWHFNLHFECIRSERWPLNFAHAVGIRASPGSRVAAYFWNDGLIEERVVPLSAPVFERSQIIRHDCRRRPDGSPAKEFFLCVEMLDHNPVVDPRKIYAFMIEYTSPLPEVLARENPAYIQILMYHQNDTDEWGWWPIGQGCLLSSGLHISGSPFEGFEALSGQASPLYSTVQTMDGEIDELVVLVEQLAYLRIDLRDDVGAPFYGGDQMLLSLSAEIRTFTNVPDGVGQISWDPFQRFYQVVWNAKQPAITNEEDLRAGKYQRNMHVLLDGAPIKNSPLLITVLLGSSDPGQARIDVGRYSPARASERMSFTIQSVDGAGMNRITGGDYYNITFEGPEHAPFPPDQQFRAKVEDNQDGTYTAAFEIQRPGIYRMNVMMLNSTGAFHIFGSPFKVVVWDELDPSLTTAEGRGVDQPAIVQAGVEYSFVVTARDTYGAQYFEGGARFRLDVFDSIRFTIDGLDRAKGDYIEIHDRGDGKYDFRYRICKAGLVSADLTLYINEDFLHIKGSPFLLDVVPGPPGSEYSQLHPLSGAVITSIITTAHLDLLDMCGNGPAADVPAGQGEGLGVTLVRVENREVVPIELIYVAPGKFTILWTPGRRGQYELSAQLGTLHISNSPIIFDVMGLDYVPTHLGESWQLGGVGASTESTFWAPPASVQAGEVVFVDVLAKDRWGDALLAGNDTFLVSLWCMGGPSPTPARCLYFSENAEVCACVPSCTFDHFRQVCHPAVGPVTSPLAFSLNLPEVGTFRLVDPSVHLSIRSAKEDLYSFEMSTMRAGRYHGTLSALRPGGLRAFYFNERLLLGRLRADLLQAPLDFAWGFTPPAEGVPATRFALVAVGWLRVPVEDTYTLQVASDGEVRLVVNGTEVLASTGEQSDAMVEVRLRAGFNPFQLEYFHGHSQRDVSARLQVSYAGGPLTMQPIPADALYFEEVLSQPDNPFQLTVRPLPNAESIVLDGAHDLSSTDSADPLAVATGRVAQAMRLRFHSVDRLGNVLVERDQSSWLRLHSQPLFSSGKFQGDSLVADRWRVVPLANGSWDVFLRPNAAPGVYILSLDLHSLSLGRLVFTRQLRVEILPEDVYPPSCSVVCVPPEPQSAGTEVTCTVVARDLEGNELVDLPMQAVVLPPSSATQELTLELSSVDRSSRRFLFIPTVAGNWTLRVTITYGENLEVGLEHHYMVKASSTSMQATGTHVALSDPVLTNESIHLNITLRDVYGNHVPSTDALWQVRLLGGHKDTVHLQGSAAPVSPGFYQAETPPVPQRSPQLLVLQYVVPRHRNNLRFCPELLPVYAQVEMLSDHRALGSVALLSCLPGYVQASGEHMLQCGETGNGDGNTIGEWQTFFLLRASILVCRPDPFFCPEPHVPHSHVVHFDWRREIGSRAHMICLSGYRQLYGGNEFICGVRAGVGVWLTLDGDDGIMPVCEPIPHLCPDFALQNGHVTYKSGDRIVDSAIGTACDPGYTKTGGEDLVSCGEDGSWKSPVVVLPRVPPQDLDCSLDTAFCPDPSMNLGPGVRLRDNVSMHLGAVVGFECVEGWEPLLGDSSAVCSWDRSDPNWGAWFAADPEFAAQVDLVPLRCTWTQGWCPPISLQRGHVAELTQEHYLGSRALLRCAAGYEDVAGYAEFECMHNAVATAGMWLTPDGLHNVSEALTCEKIYAFCPEPVGPPSVLLSVSEGLRLGSELSMGCAPGYELDTPLETLPLLLCQVGGGDVGEWAAPDGLPTPVGSLTCKGVRNWCPELQLPSGFVADLQGARGPGSTAILGCNLGFDLVGHGEVHPYPARVNVLCSDPNTPWADSGGGYWMLEGHNDTLNVQCFAQPAFCEESLPAFTNINGRYQAMDIGVQAYSIEHLGDRRYGSRVVLRCNEVLHFYYSYGDSEVVCGYNANETGPAWRSPKGRLSIPLHCYFTGTPVLDYVEIRNGCFDPTDYVVDHTFGRSGSILFWLQPSAWAAGDVLIQGEHGDGKWEMKFESEGVISAKVNEGIGHVSMDITHNQTKGLGEWFHIAFVWQLGLGLAGLGEVRVWVDGLPAQPAYYEAHRLDHFTWVDPGRLLHIGAVNNNDTAPGSYSNLRVYSRATPKEEVDEVRASEDPRCGILDDACRRPVFVHAYVQEVSNPKDLRFALFPLRLESQLTVACDPGHVRTRGDDVIECTQSGVWVRAGTNEGAELLECCGTAQDWCPLINVSQSPGLYIYSSSGDDTVACLPDVDGGGGGLGVAYIPCPALQLDMGSVTYTSGLAFGSRARLSCDVGYEPVSELDMDRDLLCFQGIFNFTVHINAVVPGEWKTPDGRPFRPLTCKGVQGWCPPAGLEKARVMAASGGQRMGSEVTLQCLPGYTAFLMGTDLSTSDIRVRCNTTYESGGSGSWTVPALGHIKLGELSCEPVPSFCSLDLLRPRVGVMGMLVDAPQEAYTLMVKGNRGLGSQVLLRCNSPYEYSHGDMKVICGLNGTTGRGTWLGESGAPALQLSCRNTHPAVEDAVWFIDGCVAGVPPHSIPVYLKEQGSLVLWFQLPNSTDPLVAWSSLSQAACAGQFSTQTSTTTTTTTTTTATTTGTFDSQDDPGLDSGNASNVLNETSMNESDDSSVNSTMGTDSFARRMQTSNSSDSDDSDANASSNATFENNTSTTHTSTTLTSTTTTTTLAESISDFALPAYGNDTLCLGSQHMLFHEGVLHAQLGPQLGNLSLHLEGFSLGDWVHAAYSWTSSGREARLLASLAGTHSIATAGTYDAVTLTDEFQVHLGVPFGADAHVAAYEGNYSISLPRVYDRQLPDVDVGLLVATEVPPCVRCPALVPDMLNESYVHAVTGQLEPPAANQPGMRVYLGCKAGTAPSGGDALLECSETGMWVQPGTGLQATWLECCGVLPDFCPEPNLTHFAEASIPGRTCGSTTTSAFQTTLEPLRTLGAVLQFRCPTGYVSISGSEVHHCVSGYPGSSGMWVDDIGSPVTPVVCELDEHWCPTLQGVNSYVATASAGRRLGSVVTSLCVGANVPLAGSMTLWCMVRDDGVAGQWVDSLGQQASALECGQQTPDFNLQPSVDGGLEVQLDRRYLANNTFACISTTRQIHGDSLVTCTLGADNASADGTGGRWADVNGDNAEVPICELRPAWCPLIDIAGRNAAVVSLSDNYRHGSVSMLRCHRGYRYLRGSWTLECVNNEQGDGGVWDSEPLSCELDHHFCPPLRPQGAAVVEVDLNYALGEAASFRCLRGYKHLLGDLQTTCQMSNTGHGGQWKRPDGTLTEFPVCVPDATYCPLPTVEHGYLESVSSSQRLGSVARLRCRQGFWDEHLGTDRQTAVCSHTQGGAGHMGGAFVVELPASSRHLLRALAYVGDLLAVLEEHEAVPVTLEDQNSAARLAFRNRWVAELHTEMERLGHESPQVEGVLAHAPGFDRITGNPLSTLRIEHLRILHRLLVVEVEMDHDFAAAEARRRFGAFGIVRVNFQDAATRPPDGWLPDVGAMFGERGNGFSYGWRCDVSTAALNVGAYDRSLGAYRVLENTVIVTDLYSTCPDQAWSIALPAGSYWVEVVVQDPGRDARASGCALQSEPLGFPDLVRAGHRAARQLLVQVVDNLTLSADGDSHCTSVSRITIQSADDAGARPLQDPLLNCSLVPEWCPKFLPPPHAHISSAPETAMAQPLGGTVQIACDDGYVEERGSADFVCGSQASGRAGEWMLPSGRRDWLPLVCVQRPNWCPLVQPPVGGLITWLSPPAYEQGSRASFACMKGLRRVSGSLLIYCNASRQWCEEEEVQGVCLGAAAPLLCEPDPEYCPPLLTGVGLSAEPTLSTSEEAVKVSEVAAGIPKVSWVSFQLPVNAAPYDTEVSLSCPQDYHRVTGDEHIVCRHGATSGVWQRADAPTTGLVDGASAALVVCELDPVYGVRRQLYASVAQSHDGSLASGEDVVPNVDQNASDFDAAHFLTHVQPPQSGLYAFAIRVVGKFTLVLEDQLLLEGRSSGASAQTFWAEARELSDAVFYELRILYEMDPVLPGRAGAASDAAQSGQTSYERMPREVHLLWSHEGGAEEIVPPTVLYHTLQQPWGFPYTAMPVNDPSPCQSTELVDLQVGASGFLLHGTPGRPYNHDLNCHWRLAAVGTVRFIFVVNYFDLEDTPGCAADSLAISVGSRENAALVGSYCGQRMEGSVLTDQVRVTEVHVDFITDSEIEGRGFNISYSVLDAPVVLAG